MRRNWMLCWTRMRGTESRDLRKETSSCERIKLVNGFTIKPSIDRIRLMQYQEETSRGLGGYEDGY